MSTLEIIVGVVITVLILGSLLLIFWYTRDVTPPSLVFPEYKSYPATTEEPVMAAKKKTKKKVAKKATKARSAKSGKYVTDKFAKKHKATTVRESW